MQSRTFLISSLAAILTLSACSVTIEPPDQSNAPAPIIVSTETRSTSTSKVRPTASGGMLTQRLTASGALEFGTHDAPITLLVITNPYCDYCREFQQEHLKRLIDDFIRPGLLKLQTIILPLQKYPASSLASVSLLCAAKQSKGVTYADLLFQALPLDRRGMLAQATSADLDAKAFTTCINDASVKMLSEKQAAIARNLGVTLVPTLIINEEKSIGLPEYSDLRGRIDALLRF